jgi:heat shock protein HtpX
LDTEYISEAIIISTVICFFVILLLYFRSTKITLGLAKAKPVTHDEEPKLYNLVEEMAVASGIQTMPKIYIIDDLAANAFACGTEKNGNIVFTKGIVEIMDRDELQGVAAHEMSHLKNGDSKLMTIVAGVGMAIGFISAISYRIMFFGGGRRSSNNDNGGGIVAIIALVISLAALILSPLLAAITQAAISRKREWMADDSAIAITRNPAGLRSALEKLNDVVTNPDSSSNNIRHLWVATPVGGQIGRAPDGRILYNVKTEKASMFDTHPPLSARIDHLRKVEQGA